MKSNVVLPDGDGTSKADVKGMTEGEWRVYMQMSMQHMMNQFSNHLHHHWVVTIICASAALGGISSFVVGILLFLMQRGM